MSRKDIIIIAALINAGLLVILFVTSLKSDDPAVAPVAALLPEQQKVAELTFQQEPTARTSGDEVDRALEQFAQGAATQSAPNSAALSSPFPSAVTSSAPAVAVQENIAFPEASATSAAPSFEASTAPSSAFPSPAAETETASQIIEVKVKKGDFLEKIAKTHKTSVDEIMKLNQLTSTRLSIGQVIKVIPNSKKKAAASTASASTKPAAVAAKYYTVKNGDNPWTIAVKNHMKLEELLKLNNLNEEKARRLKPGDQIRIK